MQRTKFSYLLFGGFTGWVTGYIFALAANAWYFSSTREIFFASLIGAFFGALLYNALMMNGEYSHRLKYSITGGMIGYLAVACVAFVLVGGIDLTRISFQNGLIFDWALIHCAIIIGIIGFLVGNRADKRLLKT